MSKFTTIEEVLPRIIEATMERPGQFLAIDAVWKSIERGQREFSMQLPPRYGKSDVARAIAAVCIANGITPFVLWITTSVFLRDQAIDADKAKEFEDRLGYARPFCGETAESLIEGYKPSPKSLVVSATIQMFMGQSINEETATIKHKANLLALIKKIEAAGKRLVIIADECHIMSKRQAFGEFLGQCRDFGAIVVMMTGTFRREDDEPIFGAITTKIGTEVKKRYVRTEETAGKPMIQVYEDTKDILSHAPHFSVSLAEAWSQNVLCQIEAKWIDVHGVDGIDYEEMNLAGMSVTEVRKHLWRLVRNKMVIESGSEMFIRELRHLKNMDRCFRGIVFCGNDRAEEDEDNKHCRDIEKEIRRQAPELTTQIVTGADSKASALIEAFRKGRSYDILIVKQMGGVGLDIPELKVELDLSTVRTFVADTQKWLRIASLHPLTKIGRLILPGDIIARNLFQEIVTSNGGDYEARPIVSSTWLEEYEPDEGPDHPSIFLPTEAGWYATNDDRLREFQDEHTQRLVDWVMEIVPGLRARMTEPDLAERIKERGIPGSYDPVEPIKSDQPRDISQSRNLLRQTLREQIKNIVQLTYPYKQVSKEVYQDAIATEWTLVKKRAGLEGKYSSKALRHITDEDDLRRLIDVAGVRYTEVKHGGL